MVSRPRRGRLDLLSVMFGTRNAGFSHNSINDILYNRYAKFGFCIFIFRVVLMTFLSLAVYCRLLIILFSKTYQNFAF